LAAPAIAALSGNWRLGLGWLAVLALAALALAAFCLPKEFDAKWRHRASAFLRRPRTWLLMASFGLNGGYSTAVAWLAASYQAQGWSSAASGSLLAVMAVGHASAILMPTLAGRMEIGDHGCC
jgi:CP family cyanate transporter-like MFS transporter